MLQNVREQACGLYRYGMNCISHFFGSRNDKTNIFGDVNLHEATSIHAAKTYLTEYIKECVYFDLNMSPAQRFVRDQSFAYAKTTLRDLCNDTLVTASLREGIENLYFLGHFWRGDDPLVRQTLANDLLNLLRGLADLLEVSERYGEVDITNWDQITALIQSELLSESPISYPDEDNCYIFGKIKYFILDKVIGAGGFGAVYKARLGKAVCTVKMVPRGLMPDVEHAIADKEVASMVNHPCLVRYYATFATTEAFVTVMEYVRGVDVIRLLHLSTRLSDPLVRLILAQLGLALCHMHYKGFLHRDVKPSNMMITVGCRVKLIDFDTAKVCFGKYANRALPSYYMRTMEEFNDGEIAGTISYMAPEMLSYKEYGRGVDWWSFGVTAFELAVGKRPFGIKDNMDFDEQKRRVCRAQYQWPQSISMSKPLKKLIRSCLQKHLSQRLCAANYHDFLKHVYFSDLDLRWVETSPEVLKFDPLTSVNAGTLTYEMRPGCESPEATPTVGDKCTRLFPRAIFTDTDSQIKLFTYSSPGFRDAIRMIMKGEVPTEQVIHITPELVDIHEEVGRFFFSEGGPKGRM